jgi:peptidoglycan/LPS O-acetylase OafA/YrhL
MTSDRAVLDHPRVDELDGLRAFLALWVVLCHMLNWCGFYELTVPRPVRGIWSEFLGGGSAVETFMILSGFAISFLLNRRRQTYSEFMTGRFFRIYPVYLFCLILGVGCSFLVPAILQTAPWRETFYYQIEQTHYTSERAHMAAHLFSHFTLLNGLIPWQILHDSTGTFLPPAWSITLEWQYYLAAPFLALAVRSAGGVLVLALIALLGQHFGQSWINIQNAFLPAQLPFFLIGIGSYHLYEWFCRSAQRHSPLFALPVAAVVALAVLSGWHRVALILWALAFGSIFVRGNDFCSRGFSGLRSILLHSWLQRLGRMSYPIYLVHYPLIVAFLFLLLHWHPLVSANLAALLLLVIGLPLILMVALALHHYIELPLMAFGKRLARRPAGKR